MNNVPEENLPHYVCEVICLSCLTTSLQVIPAFIVDEDIPSECPNCSKVCNQIYKVIPKHDEVK